MAKYKNSNGYHIRMDAELIGSPAFRDLKPVARALLIEFANIYRPNRNGHLSISTRNAAKLIRCNETTAEKAFYELAGHGFIRLTNLELWQERKARTWAITWQSVNNREPSNEWKKWIRGANMCPLPLRKNKCSTPKQGAICPKQVGSFSVQMQNRYFAFPFLKIPGKVFLEIP